MWPRGYRPRDAWRPQDLEEAGRTLPRASGGSATLRLPSVPRGSHLGTRLPCRRPPSPASSFPAPAPGRLRCPVTG